MDGKVVLVIDVPPEFEGLLPEFVRLDDAEALMLLHLDYDLVPAWSQGPDSVAYCLSLQTSHQPPLNPDHPHRDSEVFGHLLRCLQPLVPSLV